jgi:thiol-disulfide isomerase/thioredoxin
VATPSPLLTPTARRSQAVITTFNWLEYVDKSRKDTWVLEFYAPWCKHCQALEPVYKEAADNVRGLKFGKIDATEHTGIAKRWGVTGYPTIKWMRDGYVRPYNGMRNTDGFRELEQMLRAPPVGSVEKEDELHLFRNMKPPDTPQVTFLLVTNQMLVNDQLVSDKKDNAVANKRFSRVARRLQDIGGFGTVAPQVVKGLLPTPEVGGAHLLRLEKDEEPIIYTKAFADDDALAAEAGDANGIDGKLDADDLAVRDMTEWVLGHQFETVSELQKNNFFDVSRGGRMVACVVIDPGKGFGKERKAWKETLLQIARPGKPNAPSPLTDEEREQFFFGVMDGTEEDADTYLEAYGVLKQNLPQLIVFNFNSKVWLTTLALAARRSPLAAHSRRT